MQEEHYASTKSHTNDMIEEEHYTRNNSFECCAYRHNLVSKWLKPDQILGTLSVASNECVRSFGALQRIKVQLRNHFSSTRKCWRHVKTAKLFYFIFTVKTIIRINGMGTD